jgi:hypothetical protein
MACHRRSGGGFGVWDPFLAPLASPANPITVRDPFLAPLASPANPITVRDLNGNSFRITANTVNNEELRHQVLGLVVNKQFEIGEQHQFQFRMEFFNLFNHPIFRFPNVVNIGTPSTFTRITETAIPARLIQFGLRYSF